MRIRNIYTQDELEIQFYTWCGKSGKMNYEIIERGDIVYLVEFHKNDTIEYLFDLDREHALKMIKSHPTKYSLEEIDEIPYSEKIKLALRELEWKKSKSADLYRLIDDINFDFTKNEIYEFAKTLNDEGLAKAITHKDGGQLTLTLKGKELLRNSKRLKKKLLEEPEMETLETISKMNIEKEVFVTYSWDSEEHKEGVLSFCNYLREKGFNADIDRKISQEQTAADFSKMMHQVMTDYAKVIVVLSKGYKTKADQFKGGVGTEYALIIKDINENPQKYILVSFEPISKEIFPLNFRDREVLDLQDSEKYNVLFAKLQNIEQISFSPVAAEKPKVAISSPKSFTLPVAKAAEAQENNFKISLKNKWTGSQLLHSHFWFIAYDLIVQIENISNVSIADFSIEVALHKDLTDYKSKGRIKNEVKIFEETFNGKLFPRKEIEIQCGNLRVENTFVDIAFDSLIEVTIYTDEGTQSEVFNIKDRLIAKDRMGREKLLQLSDFHPKNARR